MKIAHLGKALALGTGLLLATAAFAAEKGSLKLYDTANVGGTQVPAGQYTVQWQGSGPNVDIKIMKGSQVVATVPARIVALPKAATNDGTETKSIGEKQTALTGIYFHGKAQALAIDQGHNVEMATDK